MPDSQEQEIAARRQLRDKASREAGLTLPSWETGLLEAVGILRKDPKLKDPSLLSPEATTLFLEIAQGGADGLPSTRITKPLRAKLEELMTELEVEHLAQWERDASGRYARLSLTWQGEEALARTREANIQSRRRRRVKATRRASLA